MKLKLGGTTGNSNLHFAALADALRVLVKVANNVW
jgi:hypothetical protein